METLTKENFWNEMSQKYPNAMKLFLDWVDKYKKSNDWDDLFNEGYNDDYGQHRKAPKFHELPIAMQWGIFLQFVHEQDQRREHIEFIGHGDLLSEIKVFIEDYLSMLNDRLGQLTVI